MRRKNLTLAMAVVISVLCLVGCGKVENRDRKIVNGRSDSYMDYLVDDYADPDTGVHYLIYDDGYSGGITVRYNADGSIMVTEVDKNNN